MEANPGEYGLLQCWGEKTMELDATTGKRASMEDHRQGEEDGRGPLLATSQSGVVRPPKVDLKQEAGARAVRMQQLEGMCFLTGRLLFRHEDQMGVNKSEHFIMFFRMENKVSLVEHFIHKSQHWHELNDLRKEAINLSRRAFRFRTLMDELLTRLKKVSQSPEQLDLANQLQVFLPRKDDADELHIPYPVYHQEGRRLEPREDRQPVALSRMIEIIVEMQAACLAPLCILRYHATQGQLHGPTIPFLLQVSSRTNESTTLFQHLSLLTHSAVWQLVGGSLRMELMGRSPLAVEMAKMLQRQ